MQGAKKDMFCKVTHITICKNLQTWWQCLGAAS